MKAHKVDGSFAAFVMTAILAAAIISITLQRPSIFPIVMIFVALAALVIGLPLFLFVRSQGWINGWTAALAGAVTGAAWPGSLLLFGFDTGAFPIIGIFALLGAVMGLVFLMILRHRALSPGARVRLGGGAALLATAGIAAFQLGFDHSCHNPGIRGALAQYSQESFTVTLPESEWPKVRDEVERFAREQGWSALRNAEGVDICTLPGTLITAERMDGTADKTRYTVSVAEPLESGPDFRAKFRTLLALQRRIAARWPGAISADEVTRLDWIAAPNGRPSPTPSSATH